MAYRNDPVVARFQSWSSFSEADARALVSAVSQPGVDGWHQWALALGDELIGDVGLRTFDGARQGEIGFTLAPAFRGHGYAYEACSLVLAFAFSSLGFHRVVAGIDPLNDAARAVLVRLGFRREGLERSSVFVHGAWVDDERWAILSEEFARSR